MSNTRRIHDKPIVIYYEILKYRPENLKLLYDNFQVISLPDPSYDTPEILEQADVILAPLGYFVSKEKIDISSRLKVIGSNTTGNSHIDVEYATKKGIKVVTLKDHRDFLKGITATAELTWGLIITLTRNIIPAFQSVLKGKWERWHFGGKFMLSKMNLGIVGLGRLGSMVARYGICFRMQVRYFDPYVAESPVNIKNIERVDSLEKLVELSDVVTLHLPYNQKTKKLFNKKIFNKFKTGSYFINTSRGELVDSQALLECLQSGKLAGAAIDVIDGEFEPGFEQKLLTHPLVQYATKHSNLIITPHIGGSTIDAWNLTQEYIIKKIIEVLK